MLHVPVLFVGVVVFATYVQFRRNLAFSGSVALRHTVPKRNLRRFMLPMTGLLPFLIFLGRKN